MKKRFLLVFVFLLLSVFLVSCKDKSSLTKLRFGTFDFGAKIDPFFYNEKENNMMLDLTFSKLFGTDKNGDVIYDIEDSISRDIDGFTVYSPCSLNKTEEEGIYTYTITIKENIYSSNGHEYDYKDLLFDLYVHLDPSNDNSKLRTLPIVGLNEFNEAHEDEKDDINYIEGITYTKTSVSIKTTRELAQDELSYFNIYMVPYSFLSTGVKLQPENNKFGVTKNDLKKIKNSTYYQKGTGEYYLKELQSEKYIFKSNSAFFKGKITITTLEFHKLKPFVYDEDLLITSGGDEYYSIHKNKIDAAIINYNDQTIGEVKRYNLNNKAEGNILLLTQISGTEKAVVYSAKRMKEEAVKALQMNQNHSFLELLYLYR